MDYREIAEIAHAKLAELKAEDGRATPDQLAWIAKLQNAGQEVYLWRPSDWSRIEEILTRR